MAWIIGKWDVLCDLFDRARLVRENQNLRARIELLETLLDREVERRR